METTAIDLGPLVEIVLAFAAVTLTALLGVATRYINRKAGIDLDLQNNVAINEAIERGIEFAKVRLVDKVTIQTKSDLVAIAASYAITGVPIALKRFNITPERLSEMIEARLVGELDEVAVSTVPVAG